MVGQLAYVTKRMHYIRLATSLGTCHLSQRKMFAKIIKSLESLEDHCPKAINRIHLKFKVSRNYTSRSRFHVIEILYYVIRAQYKL